MRRFNASYKKFAVAVVPPGSVPPVRDGPEAETLKEGEEKDPDWLVDEPEDKE